MTSSRINLQLAMNGWIIYQFTSLSTVFQSCQDDGRVMVKGFVQWDLVYGCEDFRLEGGLEPKVATSVG